MDKFRDITSAAGITIYIKWSGRRLTNTNTSVASVKLKCIGIDESTAIMVFGNKATVFGDSQVLVFDGSKGKRSDNDIKLGMKGIDLSIYVAGNEFKLR